MKKIIYCLFIFTLLCGCDKKELETTCVVTFDTRGGSDIEPLTVAIGSKIAKPKDPTKENCSFVNWFKDNELTNVWNFEQDVVEKNMTLYAAWQEAHPADVYMVCQEMNRLGHLVVKTYKNGELLYATDPETPAFPADMFVSGEDVYVVGATGSDDRFCHPCVWKNGQLTFLDEDVSGKATGMNILNNDVYVCGYVDAYNDSKGTYMQVGKLWKNGTEIFSTDPNEDGSVNSIAFSGHDVYIAGYETADTVGVAKIWKNGEPTLITDGRFSAMAAAVCISGSNVYVAFYETNTSYEYRTFSWINGDRKALSGENYSATPESMCVSNGDVYVVGYGYDDTTNAVAKMWKNGTEIQLTDGKSHASANSIRAIGKDVYIGGYDGNNAVIWKNGEIYYKKEGSWPYILELISIFVTDSPIKRGTV